MNDYLGHHDNVRFNISGYGITIKLYRQFHLIAIIYAIERNNTRLIFAAYDENRVLFLDKHILIILFPCYSL